MLILFAFLSLSLECLFVRFVLFCVAGLNRKFFLLLHCLMPIWSVYIDAIIIGSQFFETVCLTTKNNLLPYFQWFDIHSTVYRLCIIQAGYGIRLWKIGSLDWTDCFLQCLDF